MRLLFEVLNHSIVITVFVFVMMMIVDFFNVMTKGRMSTAIKVNTFKQYVITSFLGATPGCLGSFMNVSFYMKGLISFGAITGGMIATCGDEAFVMLALFPQKAIMLFIILFLLGIFSAYLVDKIVLLLKLKRDLKCECADLHQEDIHKVHAQFEKISPKYKAGFLSVLILLFIFSFSGVVGPEELKEKILFWICLFIAFLIILVSKEHFLYQHIWNHLCKRHLWRIFLWTFGAIFIINTGLTAWNLENFVKTHMPLILLIACIVGLIPESGPHMIFVMMFSKNLIPFSVLLASSIVQDGHGMLPLFSFSLKESVLIKIFNFFIGLFVGVILYSVGF